MTLLDVLKMIDGIVLIKRSTRGGAEPILGPVSAYEILVKDIADVWEDEVERISATFWGRRNDVPCVKIILKQKGKEK